MPADAPTLDIENADSLVAYLRDTGRIARGETPTVRVLAGGVSNKTVLVERPSGEAWVLKQALPKLRVQADWFSDPARIRREAEALRWLPKVAPPGTITPLVFEDREQFVLAMQAVPQPHENWKTMWMRDSEAVRLYVPKFGRLLGDIHRGGRERREEAEQLFGDAAFFEALRVEPFYSYTSERVPEAAELLQELIDDTRRHRSTVVHGDYSPKNVLIHGGKLVLLDHEVIHFGDPAFDLGFAMSHILSKIHHLGLGNRSWFSTLVIPFWMAYLVGLGMKPPASPPGLKERMGRHTLACLLARVVGRSPLEYLTSSQRDRQRDAVLEIIRLNSAERTGLRVPGQFLKRV